MSFNMYVPARVLFGAGQLSNLHVQKMPGKKSYDCYFKGKICKRKWLPCKNGRTIEISRSRISGF